MKKQISPASQKKGGDIAQKKEIKKRILIADDDPGIQEIFTLIFERAGFTVDMKMNGEDLVKNKFFLPDIFLIDKQLSGYDGLEICRQLKSWKQTKHIPVIMVSAAPDIAVLSKEAGADDYIEKPFEIKELLALVNRYVNGKADNHK
jgi:DNA-binding response OmpR family regulator